MEYSVIDVMSLFHFPLGNYCYSVDDGCFIEYSIDGVDINVVGDVYELADFLIDFKVRNVYQFLISYR